VISLHNSLSVVSIDGASRQRKMDGPAQTGDVIALKFLSGPFGNASTIAEAWMAWACTALPTTDMSRTALALGEAVRPTLLC
jgi:hypothetical protein